jgi:HAD superfamily hydrolase (TIGR01549 family)
LAESLLLGLEGVNQLAPKFNYQPITDTDYIRQKGMRKIIKEDLQLKWYQLPGYIRSLKKVLMPKLDELQLYEGLPEVIRALDGKAHLFILTSNIRKAVDHIIAKYELDYFEKTFTNIPAFRKHHVLKRLLKRYQLSPDQVLYVGDEVRDVDACRKVGVPVIGVSWGFNDHGALAAAEANYVVDTPEELLALLESKIKEAS